MPTADLARAPRCHNPGVRFAAIVLTGGSARRLDGADKGRLQLDGETLLDHALAAVTSADDVVVVGEPMPGTPATFVRENPPFGGPAAALLAGLEALDGPPELVAVLAVDMPRVTAATIERLRVAAVSDGAVLVSPDGRRHLAMMLNSERLRAIAPPSSELTGQALWALLAPLELAAVPTLGDEHRDVDTWGDLRELGG